MYDIIMLVIAAWFVRGVLRKRAEEKAMRQKYSKRALKRMERRKRKRYIQYFLKEAR